VNLRGGIVNITETQIYGQALSIIDWINSTLDESNKWRQGGWLYVVKPDGDVFFHQRVGTIPEEKDGKYRLLSVEKALRLLAFPEHRSSWQSRNPELN